MNRALKVWQLIDSSGMGGIETHVALLAEGLRDAGHEPVVVFLKDHGPHPLRTRLTADRMPWRLLDGSPRGLTRAIRSARPDIVHTHGYKAGICGRLTGRALGLPVVSTFHAGEPGTGKLRLYVALDRLTSGLSRNIAVGRAIGAMLGQGATL